MLGSEDVQARGQCRLHAHRPMHDQPRKRAFSSGRAPFMETHLPKGLLQIIVGPRQIRNLIAEKEMWSIALRHLQEMCNSLRPPPSQLCCLPLHMPQDELKTKLSLFY